MALIIFIAFSLLLQGVLGGELVCEDLPVDLCSFAIASSGKRCLLETRAVSGDSISEHECMTSQVVVTSMREYIETDQCIKACGINRISAVGISSDSLLEPQFTAKLCSPLCYQNCPNIVDLFYTLALAEGAFLPDMCKEQETNARRAMSQLRSSGVASDSDGAASAPISS